MVPPKEMELSISIRTFLTDYDVTKRKLIMLENELGTFALM